MNSYNNSLVIDQEEYNRPTKISSALEVKNERLRQIIQDEEERNSELDNLDGCIILARAMIRLAVETFEIPYSESENGNVFVSSIVSDEAKKVTGMTKDLSALIERKYRILDLASENVPRERVEQYFRKIQDVLNRLLTNTCPNCGNEHKMAEKVIEGLSLIGEI